MFVVAGISFAAGYSVTSATYIERRELFEQAHEIFCKDCCWKHEYIYTCTKKKEQLWKRIN